MKTDQHEDKFPTAKPEPVDPEKQRKLNELQEQITKLDPNAELPADPESKRKVVTTMFMAALIPILGVPSATTLEEFGNEIDEHNERIKHNEPKKPISKHKE